MFHQLRSFILGIVVTLALVTGAYVALAQDNMSQLTSPLAIDIQQSVPIIANILVPLNDSEVLTTTVPITVEVALRVSLSGSKLISATTVALPPPIIATVNIEDGTQDSFGLKFEITGDSEGIEFTEWTTVNLNGDMGHAVLGTVKNTDLDRDLDFLKMEIRYFDAAGVLLNRNTERTLGGQLATGEEADFELWGGVNLQPTDFDQYTINLTPVWKE